MKKIFLFAIALIISAQTFAQHNGLKGLNVGVGVPFECYDLKAAGADLHIGFDRAYPISDQFALGFYLSGGGGVLGAFHPYNEYDRVYSMIKLSAGLMMEIGDLDDKPFLLGVSPCLGVGLLDMDLVLPIEIRFGRVLNNWYVMGELTYGCSLAHETVGFEPCIRVGYNFGNKKK
jgi:hypothetical protein